MTSESQDHQARHLRFPHTCHSAFKGAVNIYVTLSQCEIAVPHHGRYWPLSCISFLTTSLPSAPGLPPSEACYLSLSLSRDLCLGCRCVCTSTKPDDALENQNCTERRCVWFCGSHVALTDLPASRGCVRIHYTDVLICCSPEGL